MSLGREFLAEHAFDIEEGVEPGIYINVSERTQSLKGWEESEQKGIDKLAVVEGRTL